MSSLKYISANNSGQLYKNDSHKSASFIPHKLYGHYYKSGFKAQSGSHNESIKSIRQNLHEFVRNSFLIEHQAKPFLKVHKYMNQLEYLCIEVADAGDLSNEHLAQLEKLAEGIFHELAVLSEEIEEDTREFRSVA